MLGLSNEQQGRLLGSARKHVNAPIYAFTRLEQKALESFVTNTDLRVFFLYGLPENTIAVLTAMYSRMKNPRGLRGVFVDSFLPAILVTRIPEVATLISKRSGYGGYDGNVAKYLKAKGITSLDAFVQSSGEATMVFFEYLEKVRLDPEYLRFMSDTALTRRFLGDWLDSYGHNSIARKGVVHMCFEQISLMAAKTIEWSRPGAGYVELSTRYVDLQGADVYPIAREWESLGVDAGIVQTEIDWLFEAYRNLLGENGDGLFASYLHDRYHDIVVRRGGNPTFAITGEVFDVLGNLLPCCTNTSLAATVTGEAFPGILRHLLLDWTPENAALVDLVIQEAAKIGSDQFARHYEPTPVARRAWEYLSPMTFEKFPKRQGVLVEPVSSHPSMRDEGMLMELFRARSGGQRFRNMEDVADYLFADERGSHDKVPSEFESVSVAFWALMSYRSWRDAQRMGFSTHNRSLVSPHLGFYEYDKPAPPEVNETFREAHRRATDLYASLETTVPLELLQLVMPMGCRVGVTYSANLVQHEFGGYQRLKGSVNHEVRQLFLEMERSLRCRYPWWHRFSTRANMTEAFLFARGFGEGKEIALEEALRELNQ